MATIFIEPGTGATFDFTFYNTVGTAGTGSGTSDTQAVLGSTRSMKFSSGISNGGAGAFKDGVLNDAGRRISIGFRFHGTLSVSNAGCDFLDIATSGAALFIFGVAINNAGKLVVLNAANGTTVYGTGSTVLSADTDYRISLVYTISSTTVNSIKVYINGTLELTISNVTLPTTNSSEIFLGIGNANTAGANVSFYISHVYIDNGTANDPGNIRVTAKRPNANGTSVQFTTQIGSGGSGYGSGHSPQVNERALSTTNGWSISTTTKKTEEYSIENIATGDNDLTNAWIVDFMGWMYASVNSTSNSPVQHIIVAGVATAKVLTTSAALYTQVAGSTTYPAGNTDIGVDSQFTTTAHLCSLFECGVIVAYIPPTTDTQTQTGKTRITATTTQTQSGKTRIQISTTQTQAGKSRITATVPKTILGIARITAKTLQTILGKTRSNNPTTQTITGTARIQQVVNKTITGITRITNTTIQTITGVGRIQQAVNKTMTGITRIQQVFNREQTGMARIQTVVDQTIAGVARITATATQDIDGVARVQTATNQEITGTTRITQTAEQIITGISRITALSSQDQTGKARIQQSVNQTQTGTSRITAVSQQTITGTARITGTSSQNILGHARIQAGKKRTITGISRVQKAVTKNQAGKARITAVHSQTMIGLSRITAKKNQAVAGKSRITALTTRIQRGRTRIQIAVQKTITGMARISVKSKQTITGLARITARNARNIPGRARITALHVRLQNGIARIQTKTQAVITGKAHIILKVKQEITGVANIQSTSTQTITGRARIVPYVVSVNYVKSPRDGNIAKLMDYAVPIVNKASIEMIRMRSGNSSKNLSINDVRIGKEAVNYPKNRAMN